MAKWPVILKINMRRRTSDTTCEVLREGGKRAWIRETKKRTKEGQPSFSCKTGCFTNHYHITCIEPWNQTEIRTGKKPHEPGMVVRTSRAEEETFIQDWQPYTFWGTHPTPSKKNTDGRTTKYSKGSPKRQVIGALLQTIFKTRSDG